MSEPPAASRREPLGRLTVGELLDVLGAPAPAPAGGSSAALAAAMAAALVGLVARASHDWPEAPGVAAQARVLHERLLELADADADAFARALEALREARTSPAAGDGDLRMGRALALAADAPVAIADAAADVHALARLAEEHGRADVAPDARVAAELAAAATRAACHLVEINLATLPGDARSTRAAEAVRAVSG